MKNYCRNEESSYWEVNNLHGWAMSQKLLVGQYGNYGKFYGKLQ